MAAETCKRIVVKIGTSTLARETGSVNFRNMELLARILSDIKGMGHEIILVSSGAIGIGAAKLGLCERPAELRVKQAVAAVGQCEMMHLYDKFFGDYGQTVAQILLTEDDVEAPQRRENLINTFETLLTMGIIPIVNENDSVSFAEIESGHNKVFGDNDTLSAVVAVLCRADLLILISDIDGLYDRDPHVHPDARRISEVERITEELRGLAGGAGSCWGTGGMCTKLNAAEIVMAKGIDMVIADGGRMENLYPILRGESVGTVFRGFRAQR